MKKADYQPLTDHFWFLERVPLWEPSYLLHNDRSEIKVGRKDDNAKVCRGHQVSRHHLLLVRSGHAEEWQGVRWSAVDQGGVYGTYVNSRKLEPHVPFPLNADDVIGVGSSESMSMRTSGKETFVFQLKGPNAFNLTVGRSFHF